MSDFLIEGDVLKRYIGTDKDIVIPAECKTIAHSVCYGGDIVRVEIPEGVEEIGNAAFFSCEKLEEVIIPASVKKIGAQAFDCCPKLSRIVNLSKVSLLYNQVIRFNIKEPFPPITSGFMPNEVFEKLRSDEKEIAVTCYLTSRDDYPVEQQEIYDAYVKKQCGKLLEKFSGKGYLQQVEALLKLDCVKIPALNKAIESCGDNAEVKSMLEGYLNTHFSSADREKAEKAVTEKKSKAPTEAAIRLAELKSQWSFKKKDDGSLVITSYKGDALDVVVPDVIGKNPVTEIGKDAFDPFQERCKNYFTRRNINSVVIPEGVKKISFSAFNGRQNGVVIRGSKDSIAEAYAKERGMKFEEQ